MAARRLQRSPLAVWEREGLKAALVKAGLPADDLGNPAHLYWRFETYEDVPVGFGGLELYGEDALLRSVVTLPPLRQIGMGRAIVSALEVEARANQCRTIYLLTAADRDFFARLGYEACARNTMPPAVRASEQFAALPGAAAMLKRIA
jgi:N-acetylglutamate synthase-like GNAT family acetyltransferase